MLVGGTSSKLTPGKAFLVGALSKTLATVVTYPYIMAKVRLQARSGSAPEERESGVESDAELINMQQSAEEGSLTASYAEVTKDGENATRSRPSARISTQRSKSQGSAVALLAKVLREEGFVGWYQGMGAQITKAVLSQALLFMLKDQFERYALVIMLFIRKFRSTQRH
ncbi:ADP/ATP carrier protein [Ceratobasidium sp. 394]|nr:ADP/ATP carrier protein [Ceratobasidium sp. 394]